MAQTRQTQATTSRLPSTRESRPALIGLAIVLIVGGALASAWLALQSGDRAYFVKVEKEVAQGARITEDDLGRVSLPEGYQDAIPDSEAGSVVGQSATTRLLPGTVLIPDMLSREAGVAEDQTQLTVPVDSSPFIRDLQPGARLALAVGGSSDGTGRTAVLAELVSVGRGDDDGGLTGSGATTIPIVVSIDVSCLSTVSQGIEDKSVTPALIGSGGESVVRATCGG
ncbi:MAG TPA: SAF domain-containing protein [Marmoricola sp.]|jgi:hypothetical protein|nr:SAF domain-containing protein [Marmoricola sp.]